MSTTDWEEPAVPWPRAGALGGFSRFSRPSLRSGASPVSSPGNIFGVLSTLWLYNLRNQGTFWRGVLPAPRWRRLPVSGVSTSCYLEAPETKLTLHCLVTVLETTCMSSLELMLQQESTTFLYFLCIEFHYSWFAFKQHAVAWLQWKILPFSFPHI